jgi:2'-hydroxyisoflavone reductase
MKLPVLGESRLLGRHWVETALARGHEPTPFNRGRTAPELFAGLEQLRGERDA